MDRKPSNERNHTLDLSLAHPLPQNGLNSAGAQEPSCATSSSDRSSACRDDCLAGVVWNCLVGCRLKKVHIAAVRAWAASVAGVDNRGPGLHDVELLIDSILSPFHVHGLGVPCFETVVPLNLDGAVRERENLIIADAEALTIGLRRENVARCLAGAFLDIHHLDLFTAKGPP